MTATDRYLLIRRPDGSSRAYGPIPELYAAAVADQWRRAFPTYTVTITDRRP